MNITHICSYLVYFVKAAMKLPARTNASLPNAVYVYREINNNKRVSRISFLHFVFVNISSKFLLTYA